MDGINGDNVAKPNTATIFSEDENAVREVRKFVIDIVRQNNGGHGGSAIGMVPLGMALWRHILRHNPLNPHWFDRDRVVLSNGHASIFLYTMLHVTGYPMMTVDEIKMYGDPKAVDMATGTWKSTVCFGHPEIHVPGVEVTTGPLGQGVANAVGLAMASKHYAELFNKQDLDVISSRIYCICGDGCLQEGVALEAMAIAGRLGLDNLVLCYDNNQVTCDGPLDWIVEEDTNSKLRAMGWHVIDVLDGDSSVQTILDALSLSKSVKSKPTMINIRTTIGYGTSTAGTSKSHHGTYSSADAEVFGSKDVSQTHTLSERAKTYFRWCVEMGRKMEDSWNARLLQYKAKYPDTWEDLRWRMEGKLDFEDLLHDMAVPEELTATRTINGAVFNKLMERIPNLMAGGADLWNSNQLGDQSKRIFDRNQPDGRVIRYGIREHAMASISNGLAAYSPQGIVPVTATFFMFYLYAAPGVRMGALSKLQVIHVATHDSIGEGQNGPTHQPVELDSLYRAMPNLLYIRPSDAEEVVGAWMVALEATQSPSIISLARDPATFKIPNTSRTKILKGGYVVKEAASAQVTLISCGSDLQFAAGAAFELDGLGIPTRVVSMPCISLFETQSEDYQQAVLSSSPYIISVESYVSTIWARFCTGSIAMNDFGYSGAGIENFRRFGLDTHGIVGKVQRHVKSKNSRSSIRRWAFLE